MFSQANNENNECDTFQRHGKDKGTELGTETETQKKDLHEVVPV